jgi:hypothetical protein
MLATNAAKVFLVVGDHDLGRSISITEPMQHGSRRPRASSLV